MRHILINRDVTVTMASRPLQFAPWTSDIELAFYSALASLKLNHDKLDSSTRKVLGLYEIIQKDPPERSTRMQIRGSALTTDGYVVATPALSGTTDAERVTTIGVHRDYTAPKDRFGISTHLTSFKPWTRPRICSGWAA